MSSKITIIGAGSVGATIAFAAVKENIKKLIAEARANHIEVIYVQNDDEPGIDLDRGKDNYEMIIHILTEKQHIKIITSICGRIGMHRQFRLR